MSHDRATVGNLALTGYEEIFGNTSSGHTGERIVRIPLEELHAPEFHPFQVNDDSFMYRLSDSIGKEGVRIPGLARPRIDGGYELLCGNRRKRASELAGIKDMPVIVRDLDDDSAVLVMVDDNLEQREKILPSERAQALRLMMEALNHNGIKGESHSYEIMVERTGIKKSQLFRIIRLTELIADLIDKVDANQLALNPAVELSYLTVPQQTAVAEAMAKHNVKPSLSQAVRLKKLKQDDVLTAEIIDCILAEEKKPPKNKPTGSIRFRKFFPPEYSNKQIEAVIVELLTDWKARAAV
jgi:ParB family chromosome partitioning protein